MFKEILRTQWKWSGTAIMLSSVAAFAIPLISIQPTGAADGTTYNTIEIVERIADYSYWFAGLALAVGLLLATAAWGHDHRGHHVYALVLPVPRWYYALLRFAAGLVLLAAPIIAMWLGSIIATSVATVPIGLRTYPHELSLRFALATGLSYSVFFAISSGTTKTAAIVLTIIGALVLAQVAAGLIGVDTEILTSVYNRVVIWPGPLEIFTGRWTLISL